MAEGGQFSRILQYGININIMIDKIRKSKVKADLDKRTDEIIRLILNKPFGKI